MIQVAVLHAMPKLICNTGNQSSEMEHGITANKLQTGHLQKAIPHQAARMLLRSCLSETPPPTLGSSE